MQKIWFARNWLPAWMGLMKRWSSDTNLSEFHFNPSWFSSTYWKYVFFAEYSEKFKESWKITTLGYWGFVKRFDIFQQDQMQNHTLRFQVPKTVDQIYTYFVQYLLYCTVKRKILFVGWTQSSVKMSVGYKIWEEPVDKSIDHVPYCFAGACKVHCEREHQQATMVGNYGKLFVPLRLDDKVPFIIWTQIQGFLLY